MMAFTDSVASRVSLNNFAGLFFFLFPPAFRFFSQVPFFVGAIYSCPSADSCCLQHTKKGPEPQTGSPCPKPWGGEARRGSVARIHGVRTHHGKPVGAWWAQFCAGLPPSQLPAKPGVMFAEQSVGGEKRHTNLRGWGVTKRPQGPWAAVPKAGGCSTPAAAPQTSTTVPGNRSSPGTSPLLGLTLQASPRRPTVDHGARPVSTPAL